MTDPTPDNEFLNGLLRRKSGRPPAPPMADSDSAMNRILRRNGEPAAQSSVRLIDPDDIDRWLEPADFTDEDGGVDETAKAAAVSALLAAKPYLGTDEPPPPSAPRVAGGPVRTSRRRRRRWPAPALFELEPRR